MVSLRRIVMAIAVAASSSLALASGLNINTADADSLAAGINGVGKSKALSIIAYRDRHGPFKSVDELVLVKGIGAAIVDKNRHNLSADVMKRNMR